MFYMIWRYRHPGHKYLCEYVQCEDTGLKNYIDTDFHVSLYHPNLQLLRQV